MHVHMFTCIAVDVCVTYLDTSFTRAVVANVSAAHDRAREKVKCAHAVRLYSLNIGNCQPGWVCPWYLIVVMYRFNLILDLSKLYSIQLQLWKRDACYLMELLVQVSCSQRWLLSKGKCKCQQSQRSGQASSSCSQRWSCMRCLSDSLKASTCAQQSGDLDWGLRHPSTDTAKTQTQKETSMYRDADAGTYADTDTLTQTQTEADTRTEENNTWKTIQ